jgi:hypothetical protein
MAGVEEAVETEVSVASAIERQIGTVANEAKNMAKWFDLEPAPRDGTAQRSPPGGPTYLYSRDYADTYR